MYVIPRTPHLFQYVTWLKEKMESTEKDIKSLVQKQKKQKALESIRWMMCAENTLKMVEVLKPVIESFKSNYVSWCRQKHE